MRLTLLFLEGGGDGEIQYLLDLKNHINNSSTIECFLVVREDLVRELLGIGRERGRRKYPAKGLVNHCSLEMCLKARGTN